MKSFARQLVVSVTATLVATAIYAGLQAGLRGFDAAPVAPAAPELTSGGKFAARIHRDQRDASEIGAVLPATARMPLLAAIPAPVSMPLPVSQPDSAAVAVALSQLKPAAGDAPHAVRHVAAAETRRRRTDAPVVLPPKRTDVLTATVVAEAAASAPVAAETDLTFGLWPATKGVVKKAANLGTETWNRFLP